MCFYIFDNIKMLYFNITIFGGKMQIHIKNPIEIENITKILPNYMRS